MRIWLAANAQKQLIEEVERVGQVETGGVLLGYWGEDPYEPVITAATGPGPLARHSPGRFSPDHPFDVVEVARAYRESSGSVIYLGDWHSHPGGRGELSRQDSKTLRRISRYEAARAPRPLMLVVTGPPYDVVGWVLIRSRPWAWWGRLTTERVEIHVFANGGRQS